MRHKYRDIQTQISFKKQIQQWEERANELDKEIEETAKEVSPHADDHRYKHLSNERYPQLLLKVIALSRAKKMKTAQVGSNFNSHIWAANYVLYPLTSSTCTQMRDVHKQQLIVKRDTFMARSRECRARLKAGDTNRGRTQA